MIALCLGLVVGYLLAIPPGPIGMAAARSGLQHGMGSARMLAVGAGLFDIAYCFVATTASAGLASWLQFDATSSPLLLVVGFAVTIGIAIVGIYQFRNPVELSVDGSTETLPASGRPFATGAAFALANLANPTFIPSLLVMSAYIMGLGFIESTVSDRALFSIGFGLGNICWLLTLVSIVLRFRSRLPQSTFLLIQRLMAATVIGFSIITGVRLALL